TICTDQNHLFLAPGVLTAGGTNRVCVSRFYPEGPADLLISLLTKKGNTPVVERQLRKLPSEKKCTWERSITVRISSGRVVVVHSELARYRPGETLRARIFALRADLTPAHGTVSPPGAWEGTRVAQWTRVRSKMGLAQVQHEIDELAPPGRWTVRARLGDGSQGSASFWVAGSASPGVRTAVRLRRPRACLRHAAAARRVGLNGDQPPSVVVADFSFQEEGTRIWQNTTVVSQVVDKPVSLEFITKHRTVVTPALPYRLKVKATRWDDKPAAGERVRICRYPSFGEQAAETNIPTCNSGDTDTSGVARVMFAAEDDGTSLTLATRRSKVQAALGPLRADSRGSRTFVPLYLNLQNVTTPVIIRGGIIYRWGATTQCPISSSTNHVQTIERNSRCNEAMPLTDDKNRRFDKRNRPNNANSLEDVNASDALLDINLLRVMLPIKVTQQMCPDSHLIAYFYHNGEFVDLTWQSRHVLPGSSATLQITTPGPALCALTVLDSASKWTPVPTVKDVIISRLKQMMDAHRNLTEYDTAGDCFLNSPEMPSNSLELTAAWLASAGVRTVGDMPLRRQCSPAAMTEERAVPRSDFSEVFREFFIHADSSRRLRRGDTTIIRYRLFNYLYEPL
ncbi:Alpha2 macroglobulin isoform 2, partial [Operophtera brumata]